MMGESHTDGPPGEERGPASEATDAGQGQTEQSQTKPSATPRKWQRVLSALYQGRSFNRFEASRELRDWTLNTTVSQLEKRGVTILRREEIVPGAYGEVRCCRYRLADESRPRALELLGGVT